MALRTVLSQGGYSVGNGVFEANVILANGDITTSNITSTVAFIGSLTGNASGSAATVTTAAQPNITSVGSLTSLIVTGNVTAGNISASGSGGNITNANVISANLFVGSGANLTSLAGANVTGTVPLATTSGTVTTAAQPNITSVGSLTGLTISNATGIVDFTTSANVTLGAVANLHISGGANGYVLSTDGSGTLNWISVAASSNIVLDTFSGNGVQTVFTLTNAPTSENYTLININGVSQLHSAYTVANANVTLSSAPANGAAIEIMTFNLGSGSNGSSGYTYVEATSNTSASVNTKYIVNTNSANLTITLPSSPALGDEVGIIDGTGNASVHAITIGRNGGNIQGAASNMTVTTDRSAFTLVYYNVSQGWVLTNV